MGLSPESHLLSHLGRAVCQEGPLYVGAPRKGILRQSPRWYWSAHLIRRLVGPHRAGVFSHLADNVVHDRFRAGVLPALAFAFGSVPSVVPSSLAAPDRRRDSPCSSIR